MQQLPLVSIICLCFNHAKFLREALDSVLNQTYPNVEVIIVDDASTDGSVAIIEQYLKQYPFLQFINNEKNEGNCRAFNRGWRQSSGEFIIDFATDDVLLPERVQEQVEAFQKLDESYGVIYTDAELIGEESEPLGFFYERDSSGKLKSFAPSGDVYADVLQRYFISTPTMMMRRSVFEKLGGYDESLAYEDFDFWVRSSRHFKYYYVDKVLTKRRLHKRSLSSGWYKPGDPQLKSTIEVCRKALKLNRTEAEKQALETRLKFEIRQAVFSENFEEAEALFDLLHTLAPPGLAYRLLEKLNTRRLKLSFLRDTYHKIRYKGRFSI